MRRLVPRQLSDATAGFGESVVWDAHRGGFWWLDMLAPRLFLTDPATGSTRTWTLGRQAYAVAPWKEGLILAEADRIASFDPERGHREELAGIALPTGVRLNDGRAMPDGAFIVGGLDLAGGPSSDKAALYRFADGGLEVLAEGFSAINGVAWMPSVGLVFADTRRASLYRLDAGSPIACGSSAWPKGFRPDGAAVDRSGAYWSAQFGRGELWRWESPSPHVERFEIDAASVTCCAFSPTGWLAVTTGGASGSNPLILIGPPP